jgi:oxidoreductase
VRAVKTVVVGLGPFAQQVWLPRLMRHPMFEVVAVAEARTQVYARVRPLLAHVAIYQRYADVPLAGIDCAFVVDAGRQQADAAAWFAGHGLAVFLDPAPILAAAELEALLDGARRAGGRLALSRAVGYRADVAAMRDVVATGVLGEPCAVDIGWVRDRSDLAGTSELAGYGWPVMDAVHRMWPSSPIRRAAVTRGVGELVVTAEAEPYSLRLHGRWATHGADHTTIALRGSHGRLVLRTSFGFTSLAVAAPTLTLESRGGVEALPLPSARLGDEFDRVLDGLPDAWHDTGGSAHALRAASELLTVIKAGHGDLQPSRA